MSTEVMTATGTFTAEQKEYLQGFMAGVAQRGLVPYVGVADGGQYTADPAQGCKNLAAPGAGSVYGTPIDDLCKQELWKHEEHGLDCWDRILAHANENKFPNDEDTFRFRFFGMFYVAPAQNSFMLRCRIPAGELTPVQMRGLADIADDYGNGKAAITTRSNIQIREIAPKDLVNVLTRLQSIGLTSKGSGVDNVRNITASPTAGIDPQELIDVRPYAHAIHYYILNQRDLYNLPRKFNIAFEGGGAIDTVADTNDIGFMAVRIGSGSAPKSSVGSVSLTPALSLGEREEQPDQSPDFGAATEPETGPSFPPLLPTQEGGEGRGEEATPLSNSLSTRPSWGERAEHSVPVHAQEKGGLLQGTLLKNGSTVVLEPGVYFRVELCGITGHKQLASDCGIVVKPSEAVAVAAAMLRVFIENGDRTNRKKARLKYLIDNWGVEKFLQETQKKLAFPIVKFPLEQCQPRPPAVRHGHIGVYRQSQRGLNYIGAVIPVGIMGTRQMRRIAALAENYGSGSIRLTPWQNLIIADVPDGFVETVKRQLVRMGFHHGATNILGGLIACTGNAGCKWAGTDTKGQAVALGEHLNKKLNLDRPINIHLTGCPHSCAQHYVGDIGLQGVKVTHNGESVEGYHIVFGGGTGADAAIGQQVFTGIPFSEIPTLLERVLKTYLERRDGHETFAEFTRRFEVKQLQEMFSE